MITFILFLALYCCIGYLYSITTEPTPKTNTIRYIVFLLWPLDLLLVIYLLIYNFYLKIKKIWKN